MRPSGATGWAAPGGKAQSFSITGLNGVDYGLRSVNIIPDGPEKMELQSYFGQMLGERFIGRAGWA